MHIKPLAPLAADLVGRKVDMIATSGGYPSALAAKSAASTIPIVFPSGAPIETGLVANLARPGGNLTGIGIFSGELNPRRLERLIELVPQAEQIALLADPNTVLERMTRDTQEVARAKSVQLLILKAGTESEINAAFATLTQLHAGAGHLRRSAFQKSARPAYGPGIATPFRRSLCGPSSSQMAA